MKTTVFFILVLVTVLEIGANPYGRERYSLDGGDENNFSCYHIQCPKGTVACKRLQTTSKDGSKLVTEVECQDEQGTAIDTVRKEEANPFDKATKFTSYSFTGHYEGSITRPINIHNNHNSFSTYNNNDESDVEIFK